MLSNLTWNCPLATFGCAMEGGVRLVEQKDNQQLTEGLVSSWNAQTVQRLYDTQWKCTPWPTVTPNHLHLLSHRDTDAAELSAAVRVDCTIVFCSHHLSHCLVYVCLFFFFPLPSTTGWLRRALKCMAAPTRHYHFDRLLVAGPGRAKKIAKIMDKKHMYVFSFKIKEIQC